MQEMDHFASVQIMARKHTHTARADKSRSRARETTRKMDTKGHTDQRGKVRKGNRSWSIPGSNSICQLKTDKLFGCANL